MRTHRVLAVFVLLVLILAPNALLYIALGRARAKVVCVDDDEDPLPLAVRVAAFLTECGATCAGALLSLVGRFLPESAGAAGADVRVVLIHGVAQSRGALFPLARRLAKRGMRAQFFRYHALRSDLAHAAEELRRTLLDLQKERGGPVFLLGFGAGGLVARMCVVRHHVPGVRRLLTLGTPNQGSLVFPPWPATLAQLRPGSPALAQLAAADRTPGQVEATAVQSELDATILPPENAYYPAAFNVTVRDMGHFTLLFSRRIFDLIDENLRSE